MAQSNVFLDVPDKANTALPSEDDGAGNSADASAMDVTSQRLHSHVQRLDLGGLCKDLEEMAARSDFHKVDLLNDEGWTSLHLACAGPSAACTEMLLQARASANIVIVDTSQTPLHLAAHSGSFAVVDMLLRAHADLNAYEPDQDFDGVSQSRTFARDPNRHQTALHIAAAGSNILLMRILLESKAELDARDSCGCTALHIAIATAEDDDELHSSSGVRVRGLKSRPERNGKLGAIIGPFEEESGRWPVVVEEGPPDGLLLKPDNLSVVYDDAIDFLLAARADVNLGNHKVGMDQSVLHDAVRSGNLSLAQKVITNGAHVNMQRSGSLLAPLHLAARKRNVELIEMLLKARANPRLAEATSKTPIDLARINNVPAHAMAIMESEPL